MKYIDLTMPLDSNTPVYPGDPTVEIKLAAKLEADGYLDHSVSLGTHNGTHIDAPAHMVANGKMLSDFKIDSFIGKGVIIDVRSGFEVKALDVVREGDIVLLYTGKSDNFNAPDYYTNYPAVPEEYADILVSKRVKLVGVDTGSIDHEPFATHKKLLSNNVLIIENLVNIGQLLDQDFTLFALPLNLSVEGSPARVIAQVN